MHICAQPISRFLRVSPSELFPGKGAVLNLMSEFAGEVDPGNPVFFKHTFMRGHGNRILSSLELFEHTRVDEIGDCQIGLWALQAHLTDDSLHATNAGFF